MKILHISVPDYAALNTLSEGCEFRGYCIITVQGVSVAVVRGSQHGFRFNPR